MISKASKERVVSNDCIVKLSSGIQSMPEVTICIVPNQGRVKQDRKEVKYLPYNAELPQALKGKKVGKKSALKKSPARFYPLNNKALNDFYTT